MKVAPHAAPSCIYQCRGCRLDRAASAVRQRCASTRLDAECGARSQMGASSSRFTAWTAAIANLTRLITQTKRGAGKAYLQWNHVSGAVRIFPGYEPMC